MSRTLGLDLGIASVGWCLFDDDVNGNPKRIRDIGSFVFSQIEDPKSGQTENIKRRLARLAHRQTRRRSRRLEDGRALFKEMLHVDFFEAREKIEKGLTPYDIKAKGLFSKLTKEELAVALYHYLKYRGYRSNRKVDAKESDDSDKKILSGIASLQSEIAEKSKNGEAAYITPLLISKIALRPLEEQRYHNSGDNYYLTVSRDMYFDEVTALLGRQISFGVVDETFKTRFLNLFSRQRDYSEGPGGNSPYRVSLDKVIGVCSFDNQQRACKEALSAKKFVLLSALNNLLYKKTPDEDYTHFSADDVLCLEKYCLSRSSVKYSGLFKELGFTPFRVKGLAITRKQYRVCFAKFCMDNQIVNGKLDSFLLEKLNKTIQEKTFDKVFFVNSKVYFPLKKALLENVNLSSSEKELVKTDGFFDDIATILMKWKTDDRIRSSCRERGYSQAIIDEVLKIENVSQAIDLSLNLCTRIIPLLEKGMTYDKAMEELGYKHSEIRHSTVIGRMPEIGEALKGISHRLTNPVVKHSLVQMRNVLNSLVDLYGCPEHFVVELSRELKKSFADRQEMHSAQLDNQDNNIVLKTEMCEKFPTLFKTIFDVHKKGEDLLRYKLYKEQGGFSPYTNKPIPETAIFDDNLFQIDHILPYSRSFDDSFTNKVLVEAKENQNKKNMTPMEYLKDVTPLNSYLKDHYIPREKIEKLTAKNIGSGFTNKDFEDSSYIATLAKELINFYMLPEGEYCRSASGSVTEKLRTLWGLSGRTHSYLSSYEHRYSRRFLSDISYKTCTFDEDNGQLSITMVEKEAPDYVFVLKKILKKGMKELTNSQKRQNQELETFATWLDYFRKRFELSEDKSIQGLFSSISYESINPEASVRKEAGLFILNLLYSDLLDHENKKDRSNDLHHAIDAAVIACTTPKIVNNLTKFFQDEENTSLREVDLATGSINTKCPIPQPYPNFRDEALIRVYERDIDKMLLLLNTLPMYVEEKATKQNTHILLPARTPEKNVSGPISKETIFGVDKRDGKLTSRISVKKLDKDNLEKIVDHQGGNYGVYLACKEWLDNKRPTLYPFLPKKGTPIKTVRISLGINSTTRVDLSNDRFADNAESIRTDVYRKKEGDQRLYFVPIYYYQISREKIRFQQLEKVRANKLSMEEVLTDPLYTITWKREDDGSMQITKKDLDDNYILLGRLPRYSLIEATINGKKCYCYSGGVTGGKFEIYSVIGDDYDLLAAHAINLVGSRHQVTVSTISEIKIRSISCLGRVS